ncbi:ribosome biogenesis GTP-binding protein YsxC [Candidatus Fermentibacteria bacterium]|nr:ribosome biogenesis GTP-binding protein YsxC [Candidatus Fermentibacteria bacterium]
MPTLPVQLESCASLAQLPKPFHPEIAFAGRSNVGKSSLINAITGVRIAPVSRTPGKTRTLRLYLWHPPKGAAICLVDLPGYGWANLPGHVLARWHPLVEGYLAGRPTLRAVVLVADLRRGSTVLDHDMAVWLRGQGMPYLVVAAKADKISRSKRATLLDAIATATAVSAEDIIEFSTVTREGYRAVHAAVAALATGAVSR